MQEGRPRESLVLFDTPIEIGPSSDINDPFKRSFGGKHKLNLTDWYSTLLVTQLAVFYLK